MTTSIILCADTHIGHRLGLAPDVVTMGGGWKTKPPAYSRKVYRYFVEVCEEVRQYTEGTKRLLVLNGDIVDFDAKDRSNQYITNVKHEILGIASDALAPLYEWVNNVVVIRGTDAHVGKDGELEEAFAADLDHHIPDSATGYDSWPYFVRMLDGVPLDIAHHVTMGGRSWTFANAANFLAADTMQEYNMRDERYPHLVIRAHVHRTADSYDNYPCRAVILPCWQLPTGYAIMRKPTRIPDFGIFVFMLDNGKVIAERKWKQKMSHISAHPWSRQLKMS